MGRRLLLAVIGYVALALLTRWSSPEQLTRVDADTPFESARLSVDGRTVGVVVGAKGLGLPPCQTRYRTAVDERRPARVVVLVDELFQLPLGGPGCAADARPQLLEVTLAAPLGDRRLYDGSDRRPQPVSRRADMASVGVLPDGVVRDRVEPFPPGGWEQSFVAADDQWSVVVVQAPRATRGPPYGRKVDEVVVHGVSADVYADPSGSTRTVTWTENGWDMQVHAAMTHGPPFLLGDALLRITNGVRVPAG